MEGIQNLKQLCEKNSVARDICRYFGTRQRIREVKAEYILQALERAAERNGSDPPDYYAVIQALKDIEAQDTSGQLGKFLVGRKGRSSRFKFTHDLLQFGKSLSPPFEAVNGDDDDDDDDEAPDERPSSSSSTGWVEHVIYIRNGLPIKFKLPTDLTEDEAKKLSGIIANLYA